MTAKRTVLTDARVLTCAGDGAERPAPASVVVEGDRVAAVVPPGAEPTTWDGRVVRLGGATVMPGLADAHTHISWPIDFEFDHSDVASWPDDEHALATAAVVRTYLESGYTLCVGAGSLKPHTDVLMKAMIERGTVAGPRLYASGLPITAVGAIAADGPFAAAASGADDMRRIVAGQCQSGVEAVKLFVSGDSIVEAHPSEELCLDDAMVRAAVEEADRHGAFVSAHARNADAVKMAVRNGVRLVHHASVLDDEAFELLAAARDDVWVCPGLHYLYAVVEGHAEPWGITAETARRARYPEELAASVEGLRKLHAAGVRVLPGGDFGHRWTAHGTYARDLEHFVTMLGLTPTEAILAATRDAADLVGLPAGRVEAGRLADLIVVEGDPTDDIALLQDHDRMLAVLKAGRVELANPSRFP